MKRAVAKTVHVAMAIAQITNMRFVRNKFLNVILPFFPTYLSQRDRLSFNNRRAR